MKKIRDLLEKRWFALTFAACTAVLFYLLLSHIGVYFRALATFFGYLKPVTGGVIIAYILNPLMKLFENRVCDGIRRANVRRGLAIFLTVFSVLVFLVLLMMVLIPQIIDSVITLFENMNTYITNLQGLLNNLYASISQVNLDFSQFMSSITDSLAAILRSLPDKFGGVVTNVVSTSYSIGAGVASFIISCILAIYFLADKERIKKGLKRLLKALVSETNYRSGADFYRRCNNILLRYIGGDLLDGLLVGAVNWVFMAIMRMPYGVLISVIVGITNLAPTFGPIVGGAIGALILLMINPWYALWFLVFTVILQTIDGYVIKPKLFGSALGVSSVSILIFLILGGRMFGVAGILLAIPCAAIFDYIYLDLVIRRIEARRMELDRARRTQQRLDT